MRLAVWSAVLAGALAMPLCAAEEMKLPPAVEKLSQKAKESVEVTLDASMLQLASQFLSNDDPDQVKVKKLVSKLKGVYVRNFEFEREGEYSASDVEAIRAQVKGPGWERIVDVKSLKGDNCDVFLKKDGNGVGGLIAIVAEPKELTVVHIEGPIDPEELRELGGHMGIPKFDKDKPKPGKGSKGDQ
jgi:Domain of unknown function (DUF4252)